MLTVIQQPGTIDLFGVNARTLKVLTGTAEQPNHRIEVTLQRYGATGFVDIPGAVMSSPLFSQQASFNLSKRLPFLYNLPIISTEYATPIANEMSYRWKALIKEYYGTPPEEQSMTGATGIALYGGVGRIKGRTYNFNTDFITRGAFLTNQPRTKLVDRLQPEFLYFPQMRTDGNNCRVNARMYFSDGTEQRVTLPNLVGSFHFSAEKGLVYMIPTGYFQTGISQYEADNKIILKYEIFVTQHNGGVAEQDDYTSEIFTYIIDYDEQSWNKRFFIFRNQLGGMDIVCSRGKREVKKTASMKTRTHYWQGNNAANTHHVSNINSLGNHSTTQNVGWSNEETRSWLGELVGSGLAWEIIDYQFVPVRITSTSVTLHKDDEDLQDFVFDFEYSENEMI